MHRQAVPFQAGEAPVWFNTGCSTGFGLELARQVIERGHRRVVTARDPAKLQGSAAGDQVPVLKPDLTQPDQVAAAVKAAEARIGGIDVRKMFEVNVFGLTAMDQAVPPGMRQYRRGCSVNLASLAGVRGTPALGQYNATKFAVDGVSEALLAKIDALRQDFNAGEAVARGADFPKAMS